MIDDPKPTPPTPSPTPPFNGPDDTPSPEGEKAPDTGKE